MGFPFFGFFGQATGVWGTPLVTKGSCWGSCFGFNAFGWGSAKAWRLWLVSFYLFFPFSLFKSIGYFVSIGLVGGLIRCFLCLRQVDLKSFVAYSSICHMGFGLGGLYSYTIFGYLGGIFILIGHGFCSSCLFYILYILYKRFRSRSLLLLKGLLFTLPVFGFIRFVFFCFNMGVPPRFSFFSEVLILVSVLNLRFFRSFVCMCFLFFCWCLLYLFVCYL